MTIIQAIARNEQIQARIDNLLSMSDHCRRYPNDRNGFARIKRLVEECYEQIFNNLATATVE